MSRSSPAGMPSSVMTSDCPCDSPAVRNRSILVELYTKKMHDPGPGARPGGRFRSAARVAVPHAMIRLLHDRYVALGGDLARDLVTGRAIKAGAIPEEDPTLEAWLRAG